MALGIAIVQTWRHFESKWKHQPYVKDFVGEQGKVFHRRSSCSRALRVPFSTLHAMVGDVCLVPTGALCEETGLGMGLILGTPIEMLA